MSQFVMPLSDTGEAKTFESLDAFTRGYVEALFFTECHSDNEELEDASFGDLAPETLERIEDECHAFQAENGVDLHIAYSDAYDATQAGRDFWFTRNRHGVGYWDREQLSDALGLRLSEAAQQWVSVDVYRGDDGLLYLA